MADKSIDEVFAGIIQDSKNIAVEAVRNAAKKTQTDILKEADNYLQKYYSNYRPTIYKPAKHQLHKSIVPVFEDKSKGDKVSIEVGVEYDSGMLKGLYRSKSKFHQSGSPWQSVNDYSKFSPDYGIVEPEWIMENFLEGIHPRTDVVYTESGRRFIYNPQQDSESTDGLMRKFFDTQLPNNINKYVQNELFNAIASRL